MKRAGRHTRVGVEQTVETKIRKRSVITPEADGCEPNTQPGRVTMMRRNSTSEGDVGSYASKSIPAGIESRSSAGRTNP
jgi:hypothetical protein